MNEPKVTLHAIEYRRLLHYIAIAFDGDTELQKYHIVEGDYSTETLARHTFREICKEAKKHKLYCYRVLCGRGRFIGFTVLSYGKVPLLYSFGIKPAYRKKEILLAWLQAVKECFMDGIYMVPLNQKNTRAKEFFEKNGFTVKAVDEKKKVLILGQVN